MRKVTLLAVAAAGAWAGWRAARSGLVGLLAPPAPARAGAAPVAGGPLATLRSRQLPAPTGQVVEKLVALLELGRERGLEVVQSVLGGRTGHAA